MKILKNLIIDLVSIDERLLFTNIGISSSSLLRLDSFVRISIYLVNSQEFIDLART